MGPAHEHGIRAEERLRRVKHVTRTGRLATRADDEMQRSEDNRER